VPRLLAGERVALVSDAGMPAISDPGGRLVRGALEAGVEVNVLPGPSAVETALVASGLVGDGYRFIGFLPRGRAALARVWDDLAAAPSPTDAFESPRRLPATLRSLAEADPERELVVCRELTKRHEEVVRGTAADLAARFAEPPRGEVTLVLGPGTAAEPDVGEAARTVAELVAEGLPRRRAADLVARLTGVPRKRLYDLSL
jgi:16S rRNA (cytidine1402-2'-O)-methyltransferase